MGNEVVPKTSESLHIFTLLTAQENVVEDVRMYSYFCKPIIKIQKFAHPTRFVWQQLPLRRTKNGDLSIVFSVQGTGGSLTGPDLENMVGDQDIGSSCRPVSSGLQVPGELGHCRLRTKLPWGSSRVVFPSKCPSITPAEMSNTLR